MLLFCLLDDRIALPTSICLFLVEKNSLPLLKQQLSKLQGFRDSCDLTSRPIQKPKPFSAPTLGQLHWAWLKREL